MAKVVLGVGSSHSPMLNASVDEWKKFEAREPSVRFVDREGRPSSYEQLLAQAGDRYVGETTPAKFAQRHAAAQAALDRIGAEIRDARLDALVVIGDDQKELFLEDNLPALLVYTGAKFAHKMRAGRKDWVDWFADVQSRYYPPTGTMEHPVQQALAVHCTEALVDAGFDPAVCTRLPRDEGQGHAFAFVYQRLLGMALPPFLPPASPQRAIPIVPVFLNTYFPPNQPTPARCYAVGQALRTAIESFPGEARVGVLGSGGLTHFAIDEEFDQQIVRALRERDGAALRELPRRKLNSGNSEIRNWIAMAGATEHLGHGWTDYIPGHRTPAGTGTGLCFSVLRGQAFPLS
jgi:hypothetical protein